MNDPCKDCVGTKIKELNSEYECRCTKRIAYDMYQDGIAAEKEKVINILENSWLRGTVARRVIDDLIEQINRAAEPNTVDMKEEPDD